MTEKRAVIKVKVPTSVINYVTKSEPKEIKEERYEGAKLTQREAKAYIEEFVAEKVKVISVEGEKTTYAVDSDMIMVYGSKVIDNIGFVEEKDEV